jgi:hypothetical protein
MPKKPPRYVAINVARRPSELERIRYTDACVDDFCRALREAAALSGPAHADQLARRAR